MSVRLIISSSIAAGLMITSAPLLAKKKPWDLERFTRCLTTTGADPLAPDLVITSQTCDSGHDTIEASEGLPSGVKGVEWVTGARHKDEPSIALVTVAFGTRFDRVSTYVGGAKLITDHGSGLHYESVYAMIGGQRQKMDARFLDAKLPDCDFIRGGLLSSETCSFTEGGLIQLPATLLDELSAAHTADPNATFRFRVEVDGGSITFTVPVAEIEAVRRKVFVANGAG